MKIETILVEGQLYEILRSFHSSYFTKKNNEVNRKLIGVWVHHLEGDRVVQTEGKFHICRSIEEVKIDDGC